ncbi:hypothetical protein NUACC26_053230 [Scytonema sp. NUACC26]
MSTKQSPTVEERLSRLETLFTNVGEQVAAHNNTIDVLVANTQAHNNTIDVLVANIQQLTENVAAVNQRIDSLAEQTNRNINNLAEQAAQDRQQAVQDRQQAAIDRQNFRNEIRQIWEYLRDRNGGSSPP